MNHFKGTEVCLVAGNLGVLEAKFQNRHFDNPPGQSGTIGEFLGQIIFASQACEEAGMLEAVDFFNSIQLRLTDGIRVRRGQMESPALASEVRHARDVLAKSLQKRKFLYVAPDRIDYIDQKELFGTKVNDAFDSAARDIEEAGNCFAAECATACVFHLMRAAEIALRAVAVDRNVSFATKPLDQQEWGTILGALESVVTKMRADEIKKWPKPEVKDVQVRFYNEVVQELRGFNEAWRRHVAHARQDAIYDRDYAASVMGHVKKFMEKAATKISESTATLLYWDVA